jgi:MoaA/NifB/PqqE/SkfB family radical SAM enzyme
LNEWLRSLDRAARALSRGVRLYAKNGSWRAWVHGTSYILRRLRGQPLPQTVFLASTYRCQCNCTPCYADVKGRKNVYEMTTEELKAEIDQIKALGAIHLILTGGEPLLREDIVSLIAHAHDIGLITRISTNGDLLNRDRVAELSRAGLNQCGIAIDDADPDTHDRLRGLSGLFDRAVQGFRFLHEYGIESRLMTYANHGNLSQGLERILDLAKQLRVNSVHINFPYASGRWAESFDEMFSEDDMDSLRRLQGFMRSPPVLIEFPTPEALCLAAKKSIICVNASGEVTPCPIVPYVMGNMRNESLADIWKRHVDALQLDYRGNCPMGEPEGRKAFRAHATSVLTSDLRLGGVRRAAEETE